MQHEWIFIGLLVIMALGLVDIRIALSGILRRENKIMATEQEIEDVLTAIGSDVDEISTDFSNFTQTIATLQAQLAAAGQPTGVSSVLMDQATAIKTKLDALASSVAAPAAGGDTPSGGNAGGDTLSGGNGNDTVDGGEGNAGLGEGSPPSSDTGDNGPPPGP